VVQRLLDSIATPAIVRSNCVDYLGANQRGHSLFAPIFNSPESPPNSARFAFLDPAAVEFYAEWEQVANDLVAHLRSASAHSPDDRGLSGVVGELMVRSDAFRSRWDTHNVRFHRTGVKRLRHPVIGEPQLSCEVVEISADAGLTMSVYSAEPGSQTAKSLSLLAGASASHEKVQTARTTDARPAH
jgi:hypothetical protein